MAGKHPKGLYPLFFTEMWERLSFYLLVGILVLYASDSERGGLGMTERHASSIYGTYLAFVYFTPFLGGMLADRVLGYRRAVFIGGVFFAIGLFLLGIPGMTPFYVGLACLCAGNGFFKPNISAMVGNLYQPGDPNRDVGFNIFYMGINIGAATANLAAAPIRNYISWQWTFWFAAIGILIGLTVLVVNWTKLAHADRRPERTPTDAGFGQVAGRILLPALVCGLAGYFLAKGLLPEDHPISPGTAGFLLGMVPIIVFFVRLGLTAPPDEKPGLLALLPVYVAGGTFFMILHLNGSALTVWANSKTDRDVGWMPQFWNQDALASYYGNAAPDVPRPDERTLVTVDGVTAKEFGTKKMRESTLAQVRSTTGVMTESLWSAGQTLAPHESDRPGWEVLSTFVYPDEHVIVETKTKPAEASASAEGGESIEARVKLVDGAKAHSRVVFLREIDGQRVPVALVTKSDAAAVYEHASAARLPPGTFMRTASPEIYQSWNPIFVVLFTPLIIAFFRWRDRRGKPISTARKIFYGMLLTTGSMVVMALGGWAYDRTGHRVAGLWLVAAYAVITIGELCLSPMSLSLVTKLAPRRLVGLMMGGWFCATAFGNKLSGFVSEMQGRMAATPFFLMLTVCALLVAGFIYLLLPRLDAALKRYGA